MFMQSIILQGLSVADLRNLIAEVINEHRQAPPTNAPVVEFITRREVAKLLQISLPTLDDYSKRGIIPAYRFGNKVRYKRNEVENSLTIVKSIKHKKYESQK